MEDLKKLLKVVEESKRKRVEEYLKMQAKHNFTWNNATKEDAFELGRLRGRIEEKSELEAAIKRLIKRREIEQTKPAENTTKETNKLPKEIESIMSILSLLALFEILQEE